MFKLCKCGNKIWLYQNNGIFYWECSCGYNERFKGGIMETTNIVCCLCCGTPMAKPSRFEDFYTCQNCGARFFKSIERQNFVYAEEDEDDWSGNPT